MMISCVLWDCFLCQVLHQMNERSALVSDLDKPQMTVVSEVSTGAVEAVVRIQPLTSPTRYFTVSKRGEVVIFDAAMR